MDDDKLIEAVARAIAKVEQGGMADLVVYKDYYPMARAAIAVVRPAVIEECARVADNAAEEIEGINADRYWQSRRLAHALRALKETKP